VQAPAANIEVARPNRIGERSDFAIVVAHRQCPIMRVPKGHKICEALGFEVLPIFAWIAQPSFRRSVLSVGPTGHLAHP